MNDEALQSAFRRCKLLFVNHEHQIRVFYQVRDNIGKVVQSCADNVKVKIYFDMLDDPIIIYTGRAENVLEIYIKEEDENPRFSWVKETLAKRARDLVSNVASDISGMFR